MGLRESQGVTDFNQAWQFIASFAGDPNTAIIDWRVLHDADKTVPGHARRGTLTEWWSWLSEMNSQGYGVFAVIAALDGNGRELANVSYIRAHYADLDNLSALQNYERTLLMAPPPSFAVQSSPGKFHTYWTVAPYVGNDRFTLLQRKLRQVFDGDKAVVDATRVMRMPGTWNTKYSNPASVKYNGSAPHLVQWWSLPSHGQAIPVEYLEQAMSAVNVIDGGIGVRHELGEPSLAAPSIEWLQRALDLVDPNAIDRGEWIALTSAIKQAGWSLTDETTLRGMWDRWCARYSANDVGENEKQWSSIRNTELGWGSLVRRVPSLRATMSFGGVERPAPGATPPMPASEGEQGAPVPPMPAPAPLDCSGSYLTHLEQQEWFKGCMFIVTHGKVLTPFGRLLNVTQFNAAYGGKKFIIDDESKLTNEPWQAATRSTLWTIPKVDHMRFLPHIEHGEIFTDELGRTGVNTYKPITPTRVSGDPTPFLNHIRALLPSDADQRILLDYLAHNVKYPGKKIPWAPVIQSAEGAGKGIMKLLAIHMMGRPYCYFPNAQELANSGSQFNAWMRNKTFILVDEIKVDERRELVEILKPMISEEIIEVQGKGVDQDLEDNFSNWLFFTNWKDAIPVNKNGRRYAIFFSPIQTEQDLIARGMDGPYFHWLYEWMRKDGAAIVTDFLLNYPIECGAIPMRAPRTSTADEAIAISRSPIERVIEDAVADQLPGFRGGWISSIAAIKRIKALGAVGKAVSPQTIKSVVEGMGYVSCGRAPRPFFQEDKDQRADLYYIGQAADVGYYAAWQGWE